LWSSVYWLWNQIKLLKLLMCNISTEYTLHNIGSIEAIHAVGSEGSFLLLLYLYIFRVINLWSQIKPVVNFCHETVIPIEFLFDNVN
jgi:hypothetical protein